MTPTEPTPWRRQVYALLIVIAVGSFLGRLLSAQLLYEPDVHRIEGDPSSKGRRWPATRPTPMPTFGSNDRSRWATVRSLVEEGTFVIGRRDLSKATDTNKYGDTGIVFEDGWQTVDKMMNPATKEFYSTKPPLLTTMVAGEYWLLEKLFGWDLAERQFLVVRIILATFNGLPWLVYLILLARLLERYGRSDWGRTFVLATAAFGTMVTPFLISLNNHTLGTFSALFALYFAAPSFEPDRKAPWWTLALAGFFAAFTVCNELPALAFAGLLALVLFFRDPRRTLCFFVPAALVLAAVFLWTNYLAIGDWKPAYSKFGSEWYEYEGSHWKNPGSKSGIDFARFQETRLDYAFHVLLGHHGLFSLTPVLLLAFAGMFWGVARLASRGREPPDDPASPPRLWGGFALFSLVVSVIVVVFYLLTTDNYGGWTNGPRWLMWLTPMWLLCLLPLADRLGQSRIGRGVAYLLLAASILSMSYNSWNPWRHPWIYQFMDAEGLIPY